VLRDFAADSMLTHPTPQSTLGIRQLGVPPCHPRDRSDLIPGALEMMVLQTLRRGPLHGYGLAQAIKRTSDELVHVEEGSLYPALQRMLKSGWLSAEWGTPRAIVRYASTS
jgi:hypothetical protein